jgi:hypothetical protein
LAWGRHLHIGANSTASSVMTPTDKHQTVAPGGGLKTYRYRDRHRGLPETSNKLKILSSKSVS